MADPEQFKSKNRFPSLSDEPVVDEDAQVERVVEVDAQVVQVHAQVERVVEVDAAVGVVVLLYGGLTRT